MSEPLVTQCPYCQTRFRLTAEQLSVAAGNVRCGACLEVFHAGDAAAAMLRTDPAPQPQPEQPAPSSLLHDDLDEPDLAALGLDESIIDEVNPSGMTGHQQSGLEAALPATRDADEEQPLAEPFTDLHEDFLATPPAQDFGPDFDHNRLGIQAPPTDDGQNTDHGIFRRGQPADVSETAAAPAAEVRSEAQPAAMPDEYSDSVEPDRREPRVTSLRLEMLEEELLSEPTRRRRERAWLWGSLCLLALLALPAQFFYYNFDALARDQRSRPLLESLCLIAQCELPARVDISRIRSANLLVRPHPEFPNALAIDVILYNRADFEQPFPVLQMHFTDAGGRDVANRRFRPEEYLSGELAGVRLMPPQTPIHVGLNMLDPGPQASGYRLEFLSP